LYDFYKILEIPRHANQEEIKKAYRIKAKLVHPDVNNSPKANEIFAVVNEAYDVLMDEKKRYLHDVKLNYADSVKVENERKKYYYGSAKGASTVNFNYDWNSFQKMSYKKRTEEDYYKRSPFFYNLFFITGTLIGFIIVFVILEGTYERIWPSPFGLLSICGLIIIREGYNGLMRKKSLLNGILRIFRK
jgi:curved DNA-binding protein CbpA